MGELWPPWPLLSTFLVASFVLAITPGPAVMYIVTRSVVQGRRHGLASVAGIALGNFGNMLAAAVGLAALFAVSAVAFMVVKYAGASYLILLGVRMLRCGGQSVPDDFPAAAPRRRVFRDGLLVALLNPKTTIFFAAFLPQFVSPSAAPLPQTILLGSLFVAIAAVTDTSYALAAGSLAPQLRGNRSRRLSRRVGGSVYIGLGLATAFAGSQHAQ